jgi:hypothetical protein
MTSAEKVRTHILTENSPTFWAWNSSSVSTPAVFNSPSLCNCSKAATVTDARAAGVTWIDTSALNGLSKQAAQQRFRHRKKP